MPADWAAAQAPVHFLVTSIFAGVSIAFLLMFVSLAGIVHVGRSLVAAPAQAHFFEFGDVGQRRARLFRWFMWILQAHIWMYLSNGLVRYAGMTMSADATLGSVGGLLWPSAPDSRVDGIQDQHAGDLRIEKVSSDQLRLVPELTN